MRLERTDEEKGTVSDDLGTIGNNLRYMRELRGMSRVDLEVASGVKIGTIIKIEQNVARPRSDNVIRLADALGVTPDQLLGYTDLPKRASREAPPAAKRGRFGKARAVRSAQKRAGNVPLPQPAAHQRKVA